MKNSRSSASARLEARIPSEVYDRMVRAARLRGLSLTGYLIATAGEDARRTIEDADMMKLAQADQLLFAQAMADPAEPNERLRDAAKRHAKLIAPR